MMIWVDFAIIGVIAISALIGLIRGLIKEAFSLVTWAAAGWIAFTYGRELSVVLTPYIELPSARIAAAFISLFVVTLIVGAIINYLLSELVKKTGLTGTDRFAGMLFGIARGALVVAVLVMLAGLTPLPEDGWWKESQLIPPFEQFAVWLREHLPDDIASQLNYKKAI